VGTQHLSYLFAYNLDGHHCQYISGSPQFNGEQKITLRQQKGNKISLFGAQKRQLEKDEQQLSSITGKRLVTRSEGAGIETALSISPRLATGRWYKKVLRMEQYRCSFLSQEWLRMSRKGFVNSEETGFLSICSGQHHCRRKRKRKTNKSFLPVKEAVTGKGGNAAKNISERGEC